MAITVVHLNSAGDTSNVSVYTTASVTTQAGDIICVTARHVGTTTGSLAVTGLSATWTTLVETVTSGSQSLCWAYTAAAQTGTLTLTYTGDTSPTGAAWNIFVLRGADTAVPFNTANTSTTSGTAATSGSITLPSTPAATSVVVAGWGHVANEGITAGTGFSVVGATFGGHTSPVSATAAETGANGTTVGASWTTSATYRGVAAEARAGALGRVVQANQAVQRASVF